MNRSILRSGWAALWLLLLTATWLSSCGQFWLEGLSLSDLESLCRGAGLTGTTGAESLESLMGRQLPDPLTTCSWFTSIVTLVGCALVLIMSYRRWRNPVSPTLVAGSLYWGLGTTWVISANPSESLLHLILAVAFCALLYENLAVLGLCMLAVMPLSGSAFVTLLLPLVLLSVRPKEPKHPLYQKLALAVGVLGILYGLYTGLEWLSLGPVSAWLLLPVIALWRVPEIRERRQELYLVLIFASLISGLSSLAIALSLGDLGAYLFERFEEKPDAQACKDNEFQVSSTKVFHTLALLLFVIVILPGEQHLNRNVLVPSQKKRISLEKLFLPFSLSKHLNNFETDPWRQRTPFPELKVHDIEMMRSLSIKELRKLSVVTTDELGENRRLSLLYSLITMSPLKGWASETELSPPLLTCKSKGVNLLHNGPTLVLRDRASARIADEAEADMKESPDLTGLRPVAYQKQLLNKNTGSGYLWNSPGEDVWSVYFPESPAHLQLGLTPLVHDISDPQDSSRTSRLEMNSLRLEISGNFSEHIHPSGTLLPIKLTLKNTSPTEFSSEAIEYLEFKTLGPLPYSPFKQRVRESFVLGPNDSTEIELTLATPTWSSTFDLSLVVTTKDGQERVFNIDPPNTVRTYYRLPPVANWVEPSNR